MCTNFSALTSPWTLCAGANRNPPPGASALIASRTSLVISSLLPKGRIFWISILPWNTILSPKASFNSKRFISLAPGCTGSRISTPLSIRSGIKGRTDPQVWSMIFASGWYWCKVFFACSQSSCKWGLITFLKVFGDTRGRSCIPKSSPLSLRISTYSPTSAIMTSLVRFWIWQILSIKAWANSWLLIISRYHCSCPLI